MAQEKLGVVLDPVLQVSFAPRTHENLEQLLIKRHLSSPLVSIYIPTS